MKTFIFNWNPEKKLYPEQTQPLAMRKLYPERTITARGLDSGKLKRHFLTKEYKGGNPSYPEQLIHSYLIEKLYP